MVEETPVQTHIVEYRDTNGTLAACALTDRLKDGLSMVYSFFHPGEDGRSLGTYMILDHVMTARALDLPYVYLGYWVRGSDKMDYKIRFSPLEALTQNGWERLTD
jgi:arginine-tRNA-protein transferase